MPVNRADKLSQTAFNALATLANTKTSLPGRPYSFAGTHWKTELERLRSKALEQVGINAYNGTSRAGWIYQGGVFTPLPFPASAYVSGEWPIAPTSAAGTTPLSIELATAWRKTDVVGGDLVSYFTFSQSARKVSYIFPSASSPSTSLLYRFEIAGIPAKNSMVTPNSIKFKIIINSPVNGRLHGRLFFPNALPNYTVSGPNAGDFSFSLASSFGGVIASCDFMTKGTVEFTVNSVGMFSSAATFFIIQPPSHETFQFDLSYSSAYQVGGIHPTQNVYRIDTEPAEYLNGISITFPDEAIPADDGFGNTYYWIGHQALSRIVVSDNTHGIFVGKTLPISSIDFYQSAPSSPTDPALEPTRNIKAPLKTFETTPGVISYPVRPAVFDTFPRFAVQRSTDTITDLHQNAIYLDPGTTNYQDEWVPKDYEPNDSVHYSTGAAAGYYYTVTPRAAGDVPGTAVGWIRSTTIERKYDQRVYYGSILRDVYIRRQPTLQGDFYLPKPPDECAPLAVEIGCIRNGAFVAFQTITIPDGKHAIHVFPFWPVFDIWTSEGRCAKKLIYRCAEIVDVQASLMMPQPGFGDSTITGPKLADFFNDTEALLNLL